MMNRRDAETQRERRVNEEIRKSGSQEEAAEESEAQSMSFSG
jgi:hypothetical protein